MTTVSNALLLLMLAHLLRGIVAPQGGDRENDRVEGRRDRDAFGEPLCPHLFSSPGVGQLYLLYLRHVGPSKIPAPHAPWSATGAQYYRAGNIREARMAAAGKAKGSFSLKGKQ